MSKLDDAPVVDVGDRGTWRAWLEANHTTATGVWLVFWRASSGRPVLDYEGTVEEALCFGWIDGQAGTIDADRRKLYFAPRKATSAWSASNRARIERLMAAARMTPAGIAAIERAKANGTWTLLDGPERGEIPDDLVVAFEAAGPASAANFASFPRSARMANLYWIASARRPETRASRVRDVAARAARGER